MKDRKYDRPGDYVSRRGFLKRPRVIVAIVFCLLLIVFYLAGRLPLGVMGVYVAASVIAFGMYGYDKFSAKVGRWRTPEKTLLTLGLIGGWPGALLAQEWIRHKSSKVSFQVVFWITVAINCAVLAWIVTQAPERIEGMLKDLVNALT